MLKNTNHFLGKIFFTTAIFLMVSCKQNAEQPPIPMAEMKTILTEVYFAEAYATLIKTDTAQQRKSNKNMDSLSVFYKEIFDKHHISAAQFDSNMEWYSARPQLLDSVYGKMVSSLDSLKTKPNNVREKR